MTVRVTTTILSSAVSQDLTDLATAKDEVGLKSTDSSADNWLGRAIAQVSAQVARYANRAFVPELVQDAFLISGAASNRPATLQLRRWPVVTILSAVQLCGPSDAHPLIEDIDFHLDPETAELVRLDPFSGQAAAWEALPVTIRYVAGFGAMIQEAGIVPAATSKVTVAEAAEFACDVSVTADDGTLFNRVPGVPAVGQYGVDAGVFTFAAADGGRTLSFLYVTRAIPDDLAMICLQLVSDRFASRGRDPSLVERETPGVGRERFWFGGAPGQDGPFAPDITAALDFYRVPVVL